MSGKHVRVRTELRARVAGSPEVARGALSTGGEPTVTRAAMPGSTKPSSIQVPVGPPEAKVMSLPDYPHGRGGMAIMPMTSLSASGTSGTSSGRSGEVTRGRPPAQKMP
jgi:hypothetical protein